MNIMIRSKKIQILGKSSRSIHLFLLSNLLRKFLLHVYISKIRILYHTFAGDRPTKLSWSFTYRQDRYLSRFNIDILTCHFGNHFEEWDLISQDRLLNWYSSGSCHRVVEIERDTLRLIRVTCLSAYHLSHVPRPRINILWIGVYRTQKCNDQTRLGNIWSKRFYVLVCDTYSQEYVDLWYSLIFSQSHLVSFSPWMTLPSDSFSVASSIITICKSISDRGILFSIILLWKCSRSRSPLSPLTRPIWAYLYLSLCVHGHLHDNMTICLPFLHTKTKIKISSGEVRINSKSFSSR